MELEETGRGNIERELTEMYAWVEERLKYNLIIPAANHNDWMDQWLDNIDWRKERNKKAYLKYAMENYNLYGEQNGDHSSMYPQSDGNGSISDASTIAKDDLDTREGFNGALDRYQAKNNGLDKAYAMGHHTMPTHPSMDLTTAPPPYHDAINPSSNQPTAEGADKDEVLASGHILDPN